MRTDLLFRLMLPLYLFFFGLGISQVPMDVDSLKSELTRLEEDSLKIKTLLHLIKECKQSNVDQALEYCVQMYNLSLKSHSLNGIIDALTEMSSIYLLSGKTDSGLVYCQKAIELSDSIHDSIRLANNLRNYGYLVFNKEGSLNAIDYYFKSLELYKSSSDSIGMAHALNGIGVMFLDQAKYDSAVYYLLETIKICKAKNYNEILIKGYISIGTAYDELEEDEKASNNFSEAIKLSKKYNQLIFLSKAYQNLGNIRYELKDFDSARILYYKAIELSEKTVTTIGLGDGYIGLGNISSDLKEYESAARYYQLAKVHYNQAGYAYGLLLAYKNQGYVQQCLGNYDLALKIYDSCLLISNDLGSLYLLNETYANVYHTYALKGNYKKAYEYLIIQKEIQDSIFNLEKEEKIASLELKYEKEKYLAENLALINENLEKDLNLKKRTNQRNRYLYGGSSIILMFIFFFTYYQQRTRKNRIIAEQRILQLEEEKKLLAARSLVEGQEEERKRIAKELHDGLGVLLSSAKIHFTTVRDKSPENKSLIDKASKLLEQATHDVRRISHNMMPGLLTKYGLFEAVEGLFDEIDDIEGLNAQLDIIGEQLRLKENTEIMVYRIVQELVNNSLKHAQASEIRMQMEIQPHVLVAVYQDDGVGFDVSEKKKSKSIGLNSIISRVKFLGGELEIDSEKGKGAKFSFNIPTV